VATAYNNLLKLQIVLIFKYYYSNYATTTIMETGNMHRLTERVEKEPKM
jgi:hypothetical protein